MRLFDRADPKVLSIKIPFYITFLLVACTTSMSSAIAFAHVHDTNLKDVFTRLRLALSRSKRGHGKPVDQKEQDEPHSGENHGNNVEERG